MVYRALVSDAGYKDSPDDRPPGPRRRQTGILKLTSRAQPLVISTECSLLSFRPSEASGEICRINQTFLTVIPSAAEGSA